VLDRIEEFRRRRPRFTDEVVTLAHGAGGKASDALIGAVFVDAFANETLAPLADGAVLTLPSGEQVKGPLAHADDFVIALRDDSGWYRSFLRDRVKVELQDPLTPHRQLLDKLRQADVHNLFAYLESLK